MLGVGSEGEGEVAWITIFLLRVGRSKGITITSVSSIGKGLMIIPMKPTYDSVTGELYPPGSSSMHQVACRTVAKPMRMADRR